MKIQKYDKKILLALLGIFLVISMIGGVLGVVKDNLGNLYDSLDECQGPGSNLGCLEVTKGSELKGVDEYQLREKWGNIDSSNKVKIRKEYMTGKNTQSEAGEKLTAEEISQVPGYKDIIKDPENDKLWEGIRKDNNKAQEVLEKMYPNRVGFERADFSKSSWKSDSLEYKAGGKTTNIKKELLENSDRVKVFGNNGVKVFAQGNNEQWVEVALDGSSVGSGSNPNTQAVAAPCNGCPAPAPGATSRNPLPAGASPGANNMFNGANNLFGGGQGAGGGGGQGGDPIMAAVQLAQSFAGFIGQMFAFKGELAGPDSPQGGSASVARDDRGPIIQTEGDMAVGLNGNDQTILAQGTARPTTNGATIDGVAMIPQQALIDTPGQETEVIPEGEDGNYGGLPPETESAPPISPFQEDPTQRLYALIIPLIKTIQLKLSAPLLAPVTAQIIKQVSAQETSGQYVKLIDHDIEFNGRDITVYALKTFNQLKAGGQNLKFHSGEIEIKFQNQKILYPRLVKNAPYGIKEIQNKLDQNNKFKLQHYTNRKSQLTDEDKTISVTDITTQLPKEKLIISKIRRNMWN